jgi:hypothetical protein
MRATIHLGTNSFAICSTTPEARISWSPYIGAVTGPGEYPLADKTYADLLDRLSKNHFANVSLELRETLLAYYSNPDAPFAAKKHKGEWAKVLVEVNDLKSSTPAR